MYSSSKIQPNLTPPPPSISTSTPSETNPAFEEAFEKALKHKGFREALENKFLQEVFRKTFGNQEEAYKHYFKAAKSGKDRSYFLEEFKKTKEHETVSAFQLNLKALFKEKFAVQSGKEKDKEKLEVQNTSRPFLSNLSDAEISYCPTFNQSTRHLWNSQTPQITHIMIGYSPKDRVEDSIKHFEDTNLLSSHYFIGRRGDLLYPTVLEDYKGRFAGPSQYGPYQSENGKYDNDENAPLISMNNHSIAVWLCLGGDERLTEAQLKFTVKLCRDIADHHKLGRDCIVSHGAARERSAPFEEYAAVIQDPALWRALAEKDLGYWVEDKDVPPVEEVPKNFDHIQALRKLGLKIDEKDKKYPLERALEVFNKQFLDRNEKELDDYGRCKLFALVKKKEQDDSVQKTAFVGQEFV